MKYKDGKRYYRAKKINSKRKLKKAIRMTPHNESLAIGFRMFFDWHNRQIDSIDNGQ